MGLFDPTPSMFDSSSAGLFDTPQEAVKVVKIKPESKGGTFTSRVYSGKKNVAVTVKKSPKGNVESVFVRDLWFGIF